MKESADAKTEKVNMLTTKHTAKYHSKLAMRCRPCNMCNALCMEDRTKHVNVLTDMIQHPKRARIVEDEAPQRKSEGKMYMEFKSAPGSISCAMHKFKIALDSGATAHVMNAS